MTRLANVERAGYFPLPLSVTNLVCTHIAAPKDGHILDPCAGEGTALVTLAEKLGLEPFGVELHEGRAKAAREAVGQLLISRDGSEKGDAAASHGTPVLHDSYLSLVTSRGGYNLLYLNPPYDFDDEDGRLEYHPICCHISWNVRSRRYGMDPNDSRVPALPTAASSNQFSFTVITACLASRLTTVHTVPWSTLGPVLRD